MKSSIYQNTRKATLMALLIVILFSLAFTGCSSDKEARRREALASQQLAFAFLQEGRPVRALNELAKADTILPNDPEIKHAMGLAYWARKEYSKAEENFLKSTEVKPDYAEAWNNLGAFYISQGRYAHALTALDKALGNVYYRSYEMALSNTGWALYKLDRPQEARLRLEEALDVNAAMPLVQLNLATVLHDLGDDELALVHVNEALRLYSEYPQAFLVKGKIQNKLGDVEGAVASFGEAYRLGPTTEAGRAAKTYMDFLK